MKTIQIASLANKKKAINTLEMHSVFMDYNLLKIAEVENKHT